ncbi:carcinine hydrolase/isopenicillin-N N-acyltransferase family protein [Clostridium sp. AM58-1XD]|uniref:carcinine hydrolase/isopenicillin-N N-acyltransferase family protein n=1 Tax=Clostridium sp. AM58-1XD TaxID=2292307 RepID=UPI0015F59F23|nr:carcinine hydrolase/isopenicillin-N N-acyltransferase family protein [Clostridium sp. AM58-1XD]
MNVKKMVSIGLSGVLMLTCTISSAACTLLGANGTETEDQNAYIASTSDNPYLPGPRKPVYVTIPQDGGYKFVHTPCLIKEKDGSFTDVGSDRGMNEKGFSWTRSWVVPGEPESVDKTPAVDWFLKLGSTVSTVDEAIEFVKNNPKGVGCQGNYIFADAEGSLAVVEAGYDTVTVVNKWTGQESGKAARANRWESEEMKPLDRSGTENKIYYNTSEYRYNRGMELLEKNTGKINVETLKQMISDRNMEADPSMPHLYSINNHGVTDGTISAEIYDPANRTFWYTYGWLDGDTKEGDPANYGDNANSWGGVWIPFILTELDEEGFYTNWDGSLTPLGTKYLEKIRQSGKESEIGN